MSEKIKMGKRMKMQAQLSLKWCSVFHEKFSSKMVFLYTQSIEAEFDGTTDRV